MLSLQNVVCRPVLLYGRIGRPSRKTFIKDTEKRVQPAGCTRKSFYGAASFLGGDSFFCQVRQQHGEKTAVRNFDELNQALAEGVDRIMFDNFTPEDTRKAVEIVGGRCETESSGGITYDTMLPYAQAGVDFISFGALTHSVKGLDMSFKAC